MKKILILISILTGVSGYTFSQISPEWVRTYNGTANNNDEALAIVHDRSDNIIVTGRVISTGNNNNFCTVKYNSAGVQQWAMIYNGTGNGYDGATGLTTDSTGNIYVTGQTRNSSMNYDIALVKYSPAGDELWVRIWNGINNLSEIPNDITSDYSGNIYITGSTEVTTSNTNYITLKYNSSGVLQWAKQYNNPINNYDDAYFVRTDAAGNIYVTGNSIAQLTGSDFLTIKYNSSGDSLWVKRYNGTTASNEIPKGFAVDGNGNVFITGFSTGIGT